MAETEGERLARQETMLACDGIDLDDLLRRAETAKRERDDLRTVLEALRFELLPVIAEHSSYGVRYTAGPLVNTQLAYHLPDCATWEDVVKQARELGIIEPREAQDGNVA